MKDYIFRSSLHTVKVSLSRFYGMFKHPTNKGMIVIWRSEYARCHWPLSFIHNFFRSFSRFYFIQESEMQRKIDKGREREMSLLNFEISGFQRNKVHQMTALDTLGAFVLDIEMYGCSMWIVHFSRQIFIKRTLEHSCNNVGKHTTLAKLQ